MIQAFCVKNFIGKRSMSALSFRLLPGDFSKVYFKVEY